MARCESARTLREINSETGFTEKPREGKQLGQHSFLMNRKNDRAMKNWATCAHVGIQTLIMLFN